jgi:tetratricopeptide (TPR) repeat protein
MTDFVLFDIVHEARDERPVYFAVSVEDFRGYYDNLRLEGIVFKLVPETGSSLTDVFPLPERSAPLVTNYAASYSRLAFGLMQDPEPDIEEAIELYQRALNFAPSYRPALNGLIAILAARCREPERALPYAERLLASHPDDTAAQVRFAGIHLMIANQLEDEGRTEEIRSYLKVAMSSYEDTLEGAEGALVGSARRDEIVPVLVSIYERLGLDEKAQSLEEFEID